MPTKCAYTVALAVALVLATAGWAESSGSQMEQKNYIEIALDCDGVLHVAPRKWYNMNFDLSGMKRLLNSTIEVMRERATCMCPTVGQEFDDNVDPFNVFLKVMEKGADGLKWKDSCAKAQLTLANGAEDKVGADVAAALDELSSQVQLPQTCSLNTWKSQGRCAVQFVEQQITTSLALHKCPNSVVPSMFMSVDVPAFMLKSDGEPNICGSDSDCNHGSCMIMVKAAELDMQLVSMGLLTPSEAQQGECMGSAQFFTEIFQSIHNRFGDFNVHISPDSGLGICLDTATRASARGVPLPWDGKLPNGDYAFSDGFISGSAFSNGGLFRSRPEEGDWTSPIGVACDQIYMFLFKHFGISMEMPALPALLSDLYSVVAKLESCRSKTFWSGALDRIALETRFKPWGLLSWLYQVSLAQPEREIGNLAMSDWRPQTTMNKMFQLPDSASYNTMATTSLATFTWRGLETCPLFDNPDPSSLDITFAGRRCSGEEAALPQASLWIRKAATELTLCTDDSHCQNGAVCTSFADFIAEGTDEIGAMMYVNQDSATRSKCMSQSHYARDLHTVLLSLENQKPGSEDYLKFCSPKLAQASYMDMAGKLQSWAVTQGIDSAPLRMQSMSSWEDPLFVPGTNSDSHSNTAMIVFGVCGSLAVVLGGAVGFVLLRRNRRIRAMLQHRELQEAVVAPSAPAMIAGAV